MDTSTESQEGPADPTEDEGEHTHHSKSSKGIYNVTCSHLQVYSPERIPCTVAVLMNSVYKAYVVSLLSPEKA